MTKKETIQSEGPPSEWSVLSPTNWKWLDDVRKLLQGAEGRQNFVNTLTDTKTNNTNIRTFFINDAQGDAYFTENNGTVDPYIGPNGELIVPVSITTGSITVVNGTSSAVRAYQSAVQNIPDVSPTIVDFHAVTFDEDSAFNLTTNRFTPTKAGKYQVTASIGYEATNVYADRYASIGITKNGTTVTGAKVHSSVSQDITVSANDLISMNGTTDYLQVAVEHNFGFTTPTWGQSFTCFFAAHKVG